MSDTTLEETSYAWKKIAKDWEEYFTSPSRPSSDEVEQYRKWLKTIAERSSSKKLNGLVLGATPELRDALFAANVDVHSLDINLEMLLAMTELLEHSNPDEVLVRGSWLDSPLASERFDIILGDAVFPNVPWNTREQFFSEIVRMLIPGGYYINRTFFVPEQNPFKNLEAVLEKYSSHESSYKTATELVFDLHILTYDPNDHFGSMKKVKDILTPIRKEADFNTGSEDLDKTLDIIWDNWLMSAADKVWLYPYQKEEEAEYQKYFEIVERFAATDHPHGGLTPMYLLKKK